MIAPIRPRLAPHQKQLSVIPLAGFFSWTPTCPPFAWWAEYVREDSCRPCRGLRNRSTYPCSRNTARRTASLNLLDCHEKAHEAKRRWYCAQSGCSCGSRRLRQHSKVWLGHGIRAAHLRAELSPWHYFVLSAVVVRFAVTLVFDLLARDVSSARHARTAARPRDHFDAEMINFSGIPPCVSKNEVYTFVLAYIFYHRVADLSTDLKNDCLQAQ